MDMTTALLPALLPAGLHDALPPTAAIQEQKLQTILGVLQQHGGQLVKTPLLEYAETLLPAIGSNDRSNTLQFIEQGTGRTLVLRADMTPQIARLAATRLQQEPKTQENPLKLCYYGQVLQMRRQGGSTIPQQRTQVGLEQIGSNAIEPVIAAALAACKALEIQDITVELCNPTLQQGIVQNLDIESAQDMALIATAFNDRNPDALPKNLPSADQDVLAAMLNNDWQALLSMLQRASSPISTPLSEMLSLADTLDASIDLLENNGFQFQDGICFSILSPTLKAEICRGGAYTIPQSGILAAGCSFYL